MAKEIRVADRFRTNELSVTPGGQTIKVVYSDGTSLIYDKIKNVDAYIRSIQSKGKTIESVWIKSTDENWVIYYKITK